MTHKETHNVTVLLQTQSYNKWQHQPYELGYKASYILTGLGQLPFDIFT